ncbi:hypothetical protein C8T65DRAFT_639709, partial [Cerioporus squamosus]
MYGLMLPSIPTSILVRPILKLTDTHIHRDPHSPPPVLPVRHYVRPFLPTPAVPEPRHGPGHLPRTGTPHNLQREARRHEADGPI